MKVTKSQVPMETLVPLMQESFAQGLTVTLGVTGNSMMPLFRNGRDSVILSPCDPISLRRWDIPLYRRSDGRYILHRIVKVGTDFYVLQGDAQCTPECGVPKDSVLAVVTGFVRKGKTVSCRNVWYRLYCTVWCASAPCRPLILKLRRVVRRLFKT